MKLNIDNDSMQNTAIFTALKMTILDENFDMFFICLKT